MPDLIRQIHRRDIILNDKYLAKTPFHTGFLVRLKIDGAIRKHANLARGILLDIGCGSKPYLEIFAPFVEKYIGLEYSPESGYRGNAADFCGDAGYLPLADESVDTILCTEVFEHLPDPERAAAEIARVLRPNGTAIITAPFFYPVHDAYDFFRYSPDGIAAIFKRHNLAVEEVQSLSGGGVTLAVMFNIYLFDLGFIWTKWLYPIGLILRPLLWILIFIVNISGWAFDQIIPSKQMSFNHLTVARKISCGKTD